MKAMGTTQISGAPLRARAHGLRTVAAQLSPRDIDILTVRAGNDTWVGPTPQQCLDDLQRISRELGTAHDELVAAAVRLETEADAIDAAARAAAVRAAVAAERAKPAAVPS